MPEKDQTSSSDCVSLDTIYSEKYNEMRRFRDFELNVAAWYTTILVAILGFIAAERISISGFSYILINNLGLQLLLSILTLLIGCASLYSAIYAHWRYEELRDFVTRTLEPPNQYHPSSVRIKPNHLIYITQSFIVSLIIGLSFQPANYILFIVLFLFLILMCWSITMHLKQCTKNNK